jgi:hypothetical protein
MSWLLALLLQATAAPYLETLDYFPERPVVPVLAEGWQPEDGLYIRVYAFDGDQETAKRLSRHGNRSLPELADRLGLSIGAGSIEVYLAPTQEAFDAIQPGAPPDWADGTAWPQHGLIFLRSPHIRPGSAESLEQVLDHELIHILVGRAFGDRAAPRWLQEGLATWLAGELTLDRTKLILEQSTLLPLSALSEGFSQDVLTARLAYAQSADFIAMIEHDYGQDALKNLVRIMASGVPAPEALRKVTGISPVELESRWLARWAAPWVRLPAKLEVAAWGVGLVGAALALVRRKKRNEARLKKWEREAKGRAFLHPAYYPISR